MKFEDTNLIDTPQTRRAFEIVNREVLMMAQSNPHLSDDGLSPVSMSLRLRVAETLQDNVPMADGEQVAAALVFLSRYFAQPALVSRADGDDMPDLAKWSQEWRAVQTGRTFIGSVSPELKQVLVAADIALSEGYKQNFSALDKDALKRELDEADRMMDDLGPVNPPALDRAAQAARAEVRSLLGGSSPSGRPAMPRP